MKELIPKDDYGVFADMNGTARVDSLFVAEMFEKNHKEVLRDIRRIIDPQSGISEEFGKRNFALTSYRTEQNKKHPCYAMTRDGFSLLVMGYTGQKAMRFKVAYINRFNQMERMIFSIVSIRKDYPMLTEAVKMAHDEPKPYHFSNEVDLLNKIITGHTTKKFRELHGIPKGQSIRPYMTEKQLELLEALQRIDIGLLMSVPDYEQRKKHLERYKLRWGQMHIDVLSA